jgi:hypothetical protein
MALVAFAVLRSRAATLVVLLAGWSILPVISLDLPGLAAFDKTAAVGFALLLGMACFAPRRLQRLRPAWLDLPIAVLCLVPLGSSLSNGLGLYDGVSGAFRQAVVWGVPWAVGRACFAHPAGHRALALGWFLAGLAYMPPIILELLLSPQLHRLVYGEHPHQFLQTIRFGGWRPTVFQHHGLMLGMWMTSAALCGYALWRSGSVARLGNIGTGTLWIVLLAVTVLCKSTGALILLLIGLAVLSLCARNSVRWPALLLFLVPLAYIGLRTSGLWSGDMLVEFSGLFGADRAQSVEYRVRNEDVLIGRALAQPWLGWGGWGRPNTIHLLNGESYMITIDGLWILVLGMHGWIGLGALLATFGCAVFAALRRLDPGLWLARDWAPTAALAFLSLLFLADGLMNAMLNPVFLAAAGGLAGFALEAKRRPQESPDRPADEPWRLRRSPRPQTARSMP